jgi:hypothetical protein
MKENNMSDQNEQPQPDPVAGRGTQHSNRTPAEFVRSLGRLCSEQQWEVVREILHPLVMQRHSAVQIAEAFSISVDTAYRWRKRLWDDLRQEAVSMQPRDFIMESVSSLREARAEAWGNYRNASTERDKRAYLQLVVQTEGQCMKLGANIGLYGGRDDKPLSAGAYNEISDDPSVPGALVLKEMIAEFLTGTKVKTSISGDLSDPKTYEDLLIEVRPTEEAECENQAARTKITRPAPPSLGVRQRRSPKAQH